MQKWSLTEQKQIQEFPMGERCEVQEGIEENKTTMVITQMEQGNLFTSSESLYANLTRWPLQQNGIHIPHSRDRH